MNGNKVTESEVLMQLRLPLMVLVAYAHSYSNMAQHNWVILLVGQTLSKVAVPVFFMMSGYYFFRQLEVWNWGVFFGKMRRRLTILVLPYVLWNLLMGLKLGTFDWRILWVYWEKAGRQIDWLSQENWMTAPANLPLWFLRDLMGVTLLSPVIYVVFSNRRLRLPAILMLALFFLSGIGAFAVPGLSVCAVFFFSLGVFLHLSGRGVLATALQYRWPVAIATILVAAAMLMTFDTPIFSSLMLLFRLVSTFAVVGLAYLILSHTHRRFSPIVCRASYFVYLSHYVIFLSFIDRAFMWFADGQLTTVHYLVAPLLKTAVLVAIYVGYKRMKKLILDKF